MLLLNFCANPVRRGEEESKPATANTYASSEAMPDLKKRIWILPFVGPEVVAEGLQVPHLTESLYKKLLKSFPSEKSPYLVQTEEDEDTFRSSGLKQMTDPKAVSKALKGSDLAGFLFGKILKVDVKSGGGDEEGLFRKKRYSILVTVSAELFDTAAGRRVAGTEFSDEYHESRSEVFGVTDSQGIPDLNERVGQMLPALADKIVAWSSSLAPKLSWYGRVLRIDGGRIYISAGRRTGLMVGDVLKVLESPKDILDSQTGQLMGQAPGRMKGTVKVVQYFGSDGAMAILQSGGGIFPDDRVELY